MNEEQILVFRAINLREANRTFTHMRTAMNRMQGHVDAVNDATLKAEVMALDATITRILERVYTLEREAANHVSVSP